MCVHTCVKDRRGEYYLPCNGKIRFLFPHAFLMCLQSFTKQSSLSRPGGIGKLSGWATAWATARPWSRRAVDGNTTVTAPRCMVPMVGTRSLLALHADATSWRRQPDHLKGRLPAWGTSSSEMLMVSFCTHLPSRKALSVTGGMLGRLSLLQALSIAPSIL